MVGQATVTAAARPAAVVAPASRPCAVAAVPRAIPAAEAVASRDIAVVTGLEQGLKGATGADGRSAYELAVEGGYVGTETQWIASLAGSGSLLQRLSSLAPQTAVVPIGPTLPFAGDAPGLPLAAVALQPGFPLALDRSTGQATYARADTYELCFVLGLTQAGISAGGNVLATRLFMSLADWTAVAGTRSARRRASRTFSRRPAA